MAKESGFTAVIPVKNPPNLKRFIEDNLELLKVAPKVVVDSAGGELLEKLSNTVYVHVDVPMWEARKIGYSHVKTPFTLNLDCDVVLPPEYIRQGLNLLRADRAEAVAIQFDPIKTGHLEFGTSLWKTEWLKKLYDYPPKQVEKLIKVGEQEWVTAFQHGFCECTYMWSKLLPCGGRLETLPIRAKHLKPQVH